MAGKDSRSRVKQLVIRKTTRLGIWPHKVQRITWVVIFCFSVTYLYIQWMWYVTSRLHGASNNLDRKIDASILTSKFNITHLNSKSAMVTTSPALVNKTPRKRKSEQRTKLILFWTTVYNSSDVHLDKNVFAMCPEVKCQLTEDRSLFEESAAVMVHTKDIGQFHLPLPPYKPPHHIWVFYNNEAPYYAGREVPASFYNGLFNWTLTYRSDSDIYHPYGYTRKALQHELPMLNVTKNYAEGRDGTVLWVCSHCNTAGRREMYYNELRFHVPIDVYGYCGDFNCPRGRFCDQLFKTKYKFYLAFENSLCSEYVTEKTWKVLSRWDMIPIVLGQANYTDILPKNSFIDVQNFSSPKALGNYILQVNASDELYNSYFEWKKTEKVIDEINPVHELPWCELCRKLHQEPIEYKVYDNFAAWWNITGDCIDPNIYYRGHTRDGMERLFKLPEQYTPSHVFNFTIDGLMSKELKEQQMHQLNSK
ncbi:unnamed protein product [Owenia fusiformis]|uniref:Fucosyltransferase n=1 Tax=Owenia fusiformis TaxID=6347 RepID=A0A8J1XQK5_OWEFU|nr:unnamed protein product [Owenia fusiformis]